MTLGSAQPISALALARGLVIQVSLGAILRISKTFGMSGNWETSECFSRDLRVQGLKERPRSRHTFWYPVLFSTVRPSWTLSPIQPACRRGRHSVGRVCYRDYGFPRRIFDSTSSSIWIWFDWRAMKQAIQSCSDCFSRLTDWTADFGSR